jgi:hypothetical protein
MHLFIRSIAISDPSALIWRRALTRATWLRPPTVLVYASLLLCLITPIANAQQQTADLEAVMEFASK